MDVINYLTEMSELFMDSWYSTVVNFLYHNSKEIQTFAIVFTITLFIWNIIVSYLKQKITKQSVCNKEKCNCKDKPFCWSCMISGTALGELLGVCIIALLILYAVPFTMTLFLTDAQEGAITVSLYYLNINTYHNSSAWNVELYNDHNIGCSNYFGVPFTYYDENITMYHHYCFYSDGSYVNLTFSPPQ